MNERIKELAEQCGFRSNPDVYDRNQSFDINKFTELIVKECAKMVRNSSLPDVYSESCLQDIADDIEEYFGVNQ